MAERSCLHCGQTPSQIKRNQTICGLMSYGEEPELTDEWRRHRWADWTDTDLARMAIVPEAFERHRRTPITQFEWIACADTTRGHSYAKTDEPDWGIRAGQCFACGQTATPPSTETPERNER